LKRTRTTKRATPLETDAIFCSKHVRFRSALPDLRTTD
jgi:hypothetical protein